MDSQNTTQTTQNEEIRKQNAEKRAKPLAKVASAVRSHERRASCPTEWFKMLGKKIGVSSEKEPELPDSTSSTSSGPMRPQKRARFSEDVEVIHPPPWFLRKPEERAPVSTPQQGQGKGSDDESLEKNLQKATTNRLLNKKASRLISVSIPEPDTGLGQEWHNPM